MTVARRCMAGCHRLALLSAALLVLGCAGPGGAGQAAGTAPASAAEPSASPPASSAAAASPPASTPPAARRPVARSPFASRRLRSYLAGRSGVVTAAMYDARTGHTWVLHPRSVQYTASIVKVEIMGTALQEATAAGRPLPESEAALMRPMIENSDNDAATALLSDVGGPSAVARFDQSAGLDHTTPSTLALIPGTSLPGWGLTTTTALDEVRLVSDFAYPNPVLTSASRGYGLSLMEHVEADQSWGVSAGAGPGATVALKNGWLPVQAAQWQVDSIGWISGHGRDYVLAVLTAGSPTEEYGIATIQALARDIYHAQRRN
jgi:beta-lactamase class A